MLENTGKPIVVPFHCTDEDIRSAGLTCTEQDPCPVYLELAAVESTGLRIFAAGNIHTANATLSTILLGTEDNGLTWREVHERVRGAGLDHLQFAGVETGWTSGLSPPLLSRDPFLLATTDGGRPGAPHNLQRDPFRFYPAVLLRDKTGGSLVIDPGRQRETATTLRDQRRPGNLEYPWGQRQINPINARPESERQARAPTALQKLPTGTSSGTEMDR
jgi:hypothetical protein